MVVIFNTIYGSEDKGFTYNSNDYKNDENVYKKYRRHLKQIGN